MNNVNNIDRTELETLQDKELIGDYLEVIWNV